MADKNKKNDNHDENNNGDNNDSGSNPTTKNGQQHEQKSSKRTYYHFIPNEIKYVIIAVAAVAIIWLGLRLVLQVENPFYIVSSESMVPTLMVGDVLVLRNGNGGFSSFSDLQVGDIIVFHSEDGGGRTIVHRIVEIYQDNNSNKEGTEGRGGERLIKTKGDANPVSYAVLDYPIEEADYYGKVIFVIPKVGLVLKALGTSPINYIIILAAIVIVAISMILLHYYRNDRKKRMQI